MDERGDLTVATTSFATDIAPMFATYRAQMIWRFDITDYETVKANAQMLLGRMNGTTGAQMPAIGAPFSQQFIDTFKLWMHEGFPPLHYSCDNLRPGIAPPLCAPKDATRRNLRR